MALSFLHDRNFPSFYVPQGNQSCGGESFRDKNDHTSKSKIHSDEI